MLRTFLSSKKYTSSYLLSIRDYTDVGLIALFIINLQTAIIIHLCDDKTLDVRVDSLNTISVEKKTFQEFSLLVNQRNKKNIQISTIQRLQSF